MSKRSYLLIKNLKFTSGNFHKFTCSNVHNYTKLQLPLTIVDMCYSRLLFKFARQAFIEIVFIYCTYKHMES